LYDDQVYIVNTDKFIMVKSILVDEVINKVIFKKR